MASQARPYEWHKSLPSPFLCKGPGIYAIINQDNHKIYVGSSIRMNHRWTEHRMELERGQHGNEYLLRAFKKNPEAFALEVVEELPDVNKETLLAREQFWMNFYRSYDPASGYNISPKAQSCAGIKRNPERVKQIADKLRGRKFSPERLARHKAALKGHKGRKWTTEQIDAYKKNDFSKLHTSEARRKAQLTIAANPNAYNRKEVLQFSPDGKFIAKYPSIKAAGEKFGSADKGNIRAACLGKRRCAFGYVWRFSTHSFPAAIVPMREKGSAACPVLQYSSDGFFLKRFSSITEAHSEMRGIQTRDGAIYRALRLPNTTAYRYLWRREVEGQIPNQIEPKNRAKYGSRKRNK